MNEDFNNYYVIATKDGADNRLYYYTGEQAFHGGDLLGNVLEAKRFNSQDEIIEFLSEHKNFWYLGFNVIEITGVTFKAIAENEELYSKFHDPLYAIR